MQPRQRSQVIRALRAVAAALVDVGEQRKRRNRKPRETPRFKTTDEMLEYAMRHKGERDVPAPDVRYRGNTSDSELPDTFGRIWAAARECDTWVISARAHDFDIVAQGPTIDEAQKRFAVTVVADLMLLR